MSDVSHVLSLKFEFHHCSGMKKLILFYFLLVACTSARKEKQPFPVFTQAEAEWVVYEGKIITDSGALTGVELSLRQGAVGLESFFEMKKSTFHSDDFYSWHSQGNYKVSYGLEGNEQGLTIIEPVFEFSAKVVSSEKVEGETSEKLLVKAVKSQELLGTPELYFKTEGNEGLVQTNKHFEALDPRLVLYRRSELFTVEGYITFEDSGTDFFERNTMENWKVSRLGEIDSVKIKYIELATEPHEGIYLKALAYSVANTTTESRRALVIKRPLRIEKSSRQTPIL